MKILMAAEFFRPYAYGGSEWSVYTLAKALVKRDHDVIILTPNYGGKSAEYWEKIAISRIPFFFKLNRRKRADVSPFWFTNIVWWIISFFYLLITVKKRNVDIIHVQGKYFLPAAYCVKHLTGIPVVVTLRDYQILCPFGFCLTAERKYKACGFKDLIIWDFNYQLKMYSSGRYPIVIFLQLIAAIRGKFISLLLKQLVNKMDVRICISQKQQQIFRTNGIKDSSVVYNMAFFPPPAKTRNIDNTLLFVGRLTPGKGILLLLDSFEGLPKHFKSRLIIIGDGFLAKAIKKRILEKRLTGAIYLLGQKSYPNTLEMMRKVKFVVMPSIWEEPFGRVALEALSIGTPVIASDRGALPEIITDNQTGYISKPTKGQLQKTIIKGLHNYSRIHSSLRHQRQDLKEQFLHTPLDRHIDIYKKLVKR